jgi:cell division transport system permease protein
VRPTFILREALRSLRRNAVPSFAAMATVLVTLLVLGVFIPIVQVATGAANDVRGRVVVDVFVKGEAKQADLDRVKAAIQSRPHAGSIQFVSKEQALKEQRKARGALYDLVGRNPLPYTFRVTPDKPDNSFALKNSLTTTGSDGRTRAIDPAIDRVANKERDTRKILTIANGVKITVAILGFVLIGASILLIANTIRLSLFARRREIEVMKLVGATDWFIRWPFVAEGVLVGAFGAALAVLLLAVGKVALVDPLARDYVFYASSHTIDFRLLIGILLAAGAAVSAFGSGLSLRRFLRV